MKTIQVMVWEAEDAADGDRVYRLDVPGSGESFFRDLLQNAETDGRESFSLVEMTEEDWQQCVRNGEELA